MPSLSFLFCLFSFFDCSTESVCFRLRRTHHVFHCTITRLKSAVWAYNCTGVTAPKTMCRKFKAHSNLHKRVARLVSVSPWDCSCARYIWGQSKNKETIAADIFSPFPFSLFNRVCKCKSRQPVVFTFKRGIQRVEGVRHALTFFIWFYVFTGIHIFCFSLDAWYLSFLLGH